MGGKERGRKGGRARGRNERVEKRHENDSECIFISLHACWT